MQKATQSKEQTEKTTIIESAKTDILGQIAENKGNNISKKQLADILNKQFKTVDEKKIPDEISSENDLELITTDEKYTIKLSEIYNGKLKKEEMKLAFLDVDKFRQKYRKQEYIQISNNSYVNSNIIQFSSFEKSEIIPNDVKTEDNKMSTIASNGDLYIWFISESSKDVQTYYQVDNGSPTEKEKVEFKTGKLFWWTESDVVPTFTGNLENLFKEYNGNTLDLSKWHTSQINNMAGMFCWSKNLTTIKLDNFDTSNVTEFDGMFNSCTNIIELNLEFLNLDSAININAMFQNCSKLKEIDLRGKNTNKVQSAAALFSNCSSLENIYLNNLNFNGATCSAMFSGCSNIKLLDMSNVDMTNAQIGGFFGGIAPEKIISPINVKSGTGNSVGFPGTQYNGSDGNTYIGLPEGKSESITLTKK